MAQHDLVHPFTWKQHIGGSMPLEASEMSDA